MPGTTTIAQLTQVLAANLTDAANLLVDDSQGNARRATMAQLRTQLSAGPQSFPGAVVVGGTFSTSASRAQFGGNGIPATGAGVEVGYDGTTGFVQSFARSGGTWKNLNLAGDTVVFASGSGIEAARITASRVFAIGTIIEAGAVAGEVAVANNRWLRGSNAAGTAQLPIASINTSNRIQLGNVTAGGTHLASFSFANGEGVNGAASNGSVYPVIYRATSTNHVLVGFNADSNVSVLQLHHNLDIAGTGMSVYVSDGVNSPGLRRVLVGAADSAGAGFRSLRIANNP
jgi:hypothetical protein